MISDYTAESWALQQRRVRQGTSTARISALQHQLSNTPTPVLEL